jgi:hypothetical protein
MKNFIFNIITITLLVGNSWVRLQAQCSTSTPSVLAKWDFNSKTVQCNGEVAKPTDVTAPQFKQNKHTYCPNINSGCGKTLLGSKGHLNSQAFSNALCLSNFYNAAVIKQTFGGATFNPKSTTFDPNADVNLVIIYKTTVGKAGCLSDFALKVLQKQFNGTTVNFEKQGVAVKRNGVLIDTQTQNILSSNINDTPMKFNFTGGSFCWDGSTEVTFEIIFGLVNQFGDPGRPGSPATTGYDDICLNGVPAG